MLLSCAITQVTLFPILNFYLQDPMKFHNLSFSMPFLSYSTFCIDDLKACRFGHDGVNLVLTPLKFIKLHYFSLTFVITPTFGI